jgi:23S rRNA (cytosine1962-C5)-methyltransferase
MVHVILKKGIKKRIERNHPWVYKNEIDTIDGEYQPGDIVAVYNFKNKF